jgi:hypothetical protein
VRAEGKKLAILIHIDNNTEEVTWRNRNYLPFNVLLGDSVHKTFEHEGHRGEPILRRRSAELADKITTKENDGKKNGNGNGKNDRKYEHVAVLSDRRREQAEEDRQGGRRANVVMVLERIERLRL